MASTPTENSLARLFSGSAAEGRLLDDLLVPPLDRALPFEEVGHVAVGVGDHLELDVTRADQVALDVHVGVAEGGLRLAARGVHLLRKALGPLDDLHAAAATARRRLDDQGEADPLGRRQRLALGLEDAGAGQDGHAGLAHRRARPHLVAHEAHQRGGGPIQRRRHFSQTSANSAFSARKP
jgi:hypothetical protein